jgi:hypothetical protein
VSLGGHSCQEDSYPEEWTLLFVKEDENLQWSTQKTLRISVKSRLGTENNASREAKHEQDFFSTMQNAVNEKLRNVWISFY